MTPAAHSPFGVLLRQHRVAAGLSQEALAQRAGLSIQAVGALERGDRRHPHPETVRRLADALDLTSDARATFIAAVPVAPLPDTPDTPAPDALAAPSEGSATAMHPADGAPTNALRYHLPTQPTPLFGREGDIAAVADQLRAGVRLLTLTGSGGVGKTRLAFAVAADLAERFAHGAAFVALAPLADPTLVLPTVAHVVGLREGGGPTLREALHDYLRERGASLLILDNMEHVLAAAPDVAELLAACPRLVVLATSRAPLRLRDEREYPVTPLPVPTVATVEATHTVVTIATAMSSPAMRMFAERARAAVPHFTVTEANVAAVAGICRRLDGLPLAIELAAARVKVLPPAALLARLERALPLLADGPRDLPTRQRTMRDALAWSYNLLDTGQQTLFRRLSVFVGRFTLEAAEAVGAGNHQESDEVFGRLGALVEQSLVRVEQDAQEARFSILEPIRQYALERLDESGGDAESARWRLATYYLELLERAEPEMKGANQVEWLNRLADEQDNLRAVLGWLIECGDTVKASRFGYLQWLFWFHRGHFAEGRRWMETILAQNPPPGARAWALVTLGSLLYGNADYASAIIPVNESLEIFRAERHQLGIALATGVAGLIAIGQNNYEYGLALLEEATSDCLREGDIFNASILSAYSAVVHLGRRDYTRASQLNEQALALARESGNTIGVYTSLYHLATLAHLRGDHCEAAQQFREALALSKEVGDRGNTCYGLEGLAVVAVAMGEFEHAARLWGAAEVSLETGEPAMMIHMPDRSVKDAALADTQSRLGRVAFSRAWAQGRALTFEQAVEYAFAWEPRKGC